MTIINKNIYWILLIILIIIIMIILLNKYINYVIDNRFNKYINNSDEDRIELSDMDETMDESYLNLQ